MQIKEMTYYNFFSSEYSYTTWFLGRVDGWTEAPCASYFIIYEN